MKLIYPPLPLKPVWDPPLIETSVYPVHFELFIGDQPSKLVADAPWEEESPCDRVQRELNEAERLISESVRMP